MAIVLPCSVFFHIGRTGGHWVNHVLWRAGLIQERLHPLHVTPAQVAALPAVAERPFRFCFVRHPLRWAASLWRHEMEFGWSASEMSRNVRSDSFAVFLQRMIDSYPEGGCQRAMAPYVDHCTYVGQLETVSADLHQALTVAGESMDEQLLALPPVNESTIDALRTGCTAPLPVLEAFMHCDAKFCERFGYADVPESLIGAAQPAPWPRLRTVPADQRLAEPSGALDLARTRFQYHLDDGRTIASDDHEQRLQWSLIAAARRFGQQGRYAVVSESDPYFAYLLADQPDSRPFLVAARNDVVPSRLMSALSEPIEVVDFAAFVADDTPLDGIALIDSADINPLIEGELIACARKLRLGGQLLIVAPGLQVDAPLATTLPLALAIRGSRKVTYRSFEQLRILLESHGFADVQLLDQFNEVAADPATRAHMERLAAAIGADAGHLLGKLVVLATRSEPDPEAAALAALWQRRSIIDLTDVPYDFLPAATHARLLALEAEARAERLRRDQAEQGLADREHELVTARHQLQNLSVDADYSRELVRQSRLTQERLQIELDELRRIVGALALQP